MAGQDSTATRPNFYLVSNNQGTVNPKNEEIDYVPPLSSDDETDQDMTDHPTREELDAKLATQEARGETRFAILDGKLDRLLLEVQHGIEIGKEAKEEARLARVAVASIKWNFGFVVLAALGAIIAVVLTMWTISYQITDTVRQSNLPAAKTESQLPPTSRTTP